MYINPCWCGVVATLGVEVIATIVWAFMLGTKEEK